MNKKLVAMMSAMVMCFSALPICNAYAETYVDIMPEIPVDVQDVFPEWVPTNFTEALNFENKYGKTHIEDGLICCVRKKYNYDDCNKYLTEYSDESNIELFLMRLIISSCPKSPTNPTRKPIRSILTF